jgi:LacI family transcriptional regulator
MPITIRDVAEAAGVSIATVSRVLNNKDHPVGVETRRRILATADALGYRPNVAARSLRTDRSATVGIIADDITGPFSTKIIRGIQDGLRQAGYLCVIISADWDPDAEREAIHDLVSRSIDGIVFSETWHHTAVESLDLASKPYVFVHRQFAAPGQASVIPDERYGAHLAMRHLFSLGHRRIGYINGPEQYYASALRLEGYRAELAGAGLEFDAALVARGDWELESGYAAMQRLLEARPRLTALFAGNDLMAAGAIYALQDAGLRVPHDVAVVGYDDREISRTFRPRLTTVTLPCYALGQAAAQMLLDRMAGKLEVSEEVQVRGCLLVRESCGAAGQASRTALTQSY